MAESRIHKAPKSFYFDFSGAPETAVEIIERINKKQYDNLDAFLKSIEWELVGDELIETINLRHFTKCIADDEVRLDVMKFLHTYARQYFREAAEKAEYAEKREGMFAVVPQVHIKTADERVALFQQELAYLIQQVEEKGEFSGDKLSKLQKQVDKLEKQVKELKDKNDELETELDRFRHPYDYQKHIPEPLRNKLFYDIMSYLKNKQLVTISYVQTAWGEQPCCYYWCGTQSLFGYFVIHVSDALNLKGGRDTYNWQTFEPAILNFDKVITEARKANSTCKKNNSKIKDSEKIDEAIQFALKNNASK